MLTIKAIIGQIKASKRNSLFGAIIRMSKMIEGMKLLKRYSQYSAVVNIIIEISYF